VLTKPRIARLQTLLPQLAPLLSLRALHHTATTAHDLIRAPHPLSAALVAADCHLTPTRLSRWCMALDAVVSETHQQRVSLVLDAVWALAGPAQRLRRLLMWSAAGKATCGHTHYAVDLARGRFDCIDPAQEGLGKIQRVSPGGAPTGRSLLVWQVRARSVHEWIGTMVMVLDAVLEPRRLEAWATLVDALLQPGRVVVAEKALESILPSLSNLEARMGPRTPSPTSPRTSRTPELEHCTQAALGEEPETWGPSQGVGDAGDGVEDGSSGREKALGPYCVSGVQPSSVPMDLPPVTMSFVSSDDEEARGGRSLGARATEEHSMGWQGARNVPEVGVGGNVPPPPSAWGRRGSGADKETTEGAQGRRRGLGALAARSPQQDRQVSGGAALDWSPFVHGADQAASTGVLALLARACLPEDLSAVARVVSDAVGEPGGRRAVLELADSALDAALSGGPPGVAAWPAILRSAAALTWRLWVNFCLESHVREGL